MRSNGRQGDLSVRDLPKRKCCWWRAPGSTRALKNLFWPLVSKTDHSISWPLIHERSENYQWRTEGFYHWTFVTKMNEYMAEWINGRTHMQTKLLLGFQLKLRYKLKQWFPILADHQKHLGSYVKIKSYHLCSFEPTDQ